MSLFDVAIKLIHQETIFKLTVSLELLQYLTDFMNSGIGFFIESFIPFLSDFESLTLRESAFSFPTLSNLNFGSKLEQDREFLGS